MSKLKIVDVAPSAPRLPVYPSPDFVCGLRKVGPSQYVLVTGQVVGGVPDFKVDTIPESLDNAAEMLRASFQSLMETIV